MDYKYEFERLLLMAQQVVNCGKKNIRPGAYAPYTALKNAVDYYNSTEQAVQAEADNDGICKCHWSLGFKPNVCTACGKRTA